MDNYFSNCLGRVDFACDSQLHHCTKKAELSTHPFVHPINDGFRNNQVLRLRVPPNTSHSNEQQKQYAKQYKSIDPRIFLYLLRNH